MNFSGLRIFLCTTPTSMTYSFDRLMSLAQETFEQDPLSGHLFLFLNRQRDRVKILLGSRWVLHLVQAVGGRHVSAANRCQRCARNRIGLDPIEQLAGRN